VCALTLCRFDGDPAKFARQPHTADQAKAARASKLCMHGSWRGEVQKRRVWIRKLSRGDVLASATWPANCLFTGSCYRSGQLGGDHGLRLARVSIESQLRGDWPYPPGRKDSDRLWRRHRDFQRAKVKLASHEAVPRVIG
jgi:hypothetical protein